MSTLRIVADENIPQVEAAFDGVGEVRLADGRTLTRAQLTEADVLLVRSVTRVDEELLADTPVRFVGTATIGTDHVDREYLSRAGIAFASAKGCNANSVAEYIVSVLLEIAAHEGTTLAGKTLGIVGHGNIGGVVARYAPILGLNVLVNDPPQQRARIPGEWTGLDAVLRHSDFVTFHVPLNREGQDRTLHLMGEAQLATMKPGAWLINSSRGQVVDNAALLSALEDKRLAGAVLDVWENEPDISRALLRRCLIATPHIAGYSIDGKLNGTRLMLNAVSRHFDLVQAWEPQLPRVDQPIVALGSVSDREEALRRAARHAYKLLADDASLRAGMEREGREWPAYFDMLRRKYPVRHEFRHFRVEDAGIDGDILNALHDLGFKTGA
ncbi:MAG: erythronate-4-phosphate dehydrogenase [Candidatus Sumerlaeota bacterium]|nr:erythronate-4-phosphate dehydrogenase [Candidatus Sumerlaeota bacterium]